MMLVELGLAEPPQRDENGRFTGDMNAAIRQAAGR